MSIMSTNLAPSSGWLTWISGPLASTTAPHGTACGDAVAARNAAADGLAEPSCR